MTKEKTSKQKRKEYFRKRKAEILANSKSHDKKWQHAIRIIGHDFEEAKELKDRAIQLKPRTSLGKNLVR